MSGTCLTWAIRSNSHLKSPLKFGWKNGWETQGNNLWDGLSEQCMTTPIRYWIVTLSRDIWRCSDSSYVRANCRTYTCIGSVWGKKNCWTKPLSKSKNKRSTSLVGLLLPILLKVGNRNCQFLLSKILQKNDGQGLFARRFYAFFSSEKRRQHRSSFWSDVVCHFLKSEGSDCAAFSSILTKKATQSITFGRWFSVVF